MLTSFAYILCLAAGSNPQIYTLYYTWSISCLFSIIAIFHHLKTFKTLRKLLDITYYALKTSTPFLQVILTSYLIFALVAVSIFGGEINSESPEIWYERTGGEVNADYIYMNWNDFGNAMVNLHTIYFEGIMGPSELAMVWASKGRDHREWFFVAYYVVNNMIFLNVFIGMLIGIGLEYFQGVLEERKFEKYINNFVPQRPRGTLYRRTKNL